MAFTDYDTLLPEQGAAELLHWSVKTLQRRRLQGLPPKFIKLGNRSVRYRLADLRAFVAAGARASTTDPGDSHAA